MEINCFDWYMWKHDRSKPFFVNEEPSTVFFHFCWGIGASPTHETKGQLIQKFRSPPIYMVYSGQVVVRGRHPLPHPRVHHHMITLLKLSPVQSWFPPPLSTSFIKGIKHIRWQIHDITGDISNRSTVCGIWGNRRIWNISWFFCCNDEYWHWSLMYLWTYGLHFAISRLRLTAENFHVVWNLKE